jgi:monoamine oxidase
VSESVDCVIIGAGVAGLAAAGELRRAGRRVLVLEARERVGGRILTVRHPHVSAALELGAEFAHGEAAETCGLARHAGLMLCETAGESWRAVGRRLVRQDDLWSGIDRVLARLDADRDPDRSFLEFLNRRPGGKRLARERTLARGFVQGFHAADTARISERALAESGTIAETMRHTARIVDGYDRIVDALAAPLADAIRTGHLVKGVEWSRGAARIQALARGGGGFQSATTAVIVTVPLGVLQADTQAEAAIVFTPELPSATRTAIQQLAMGGVVRITMVLKDRVWESPAVAGLPRGGTLDRLGYLHTSNGEFNVWWTLFPLLEPVIVGWSGGPPARALAARGRAAVEDTAVAELASTLGLGRRRLESKLEDLLLHEWDSDAFTLGAYSYATVGGADSSKRLARPIARTLFFAGEAADAQGRTGTVEGAIGSGRRAAQQVLSILD